MFRSKLCNLENNSVAALYAESAGSKYHRFIMYVISGAANFSHGTDQTDDKIKQI